MVTAAAAFEVVTNDNVGLGKEEWSSFFYLLCNPTGVCAKWVRQLYSVQQNSYRAGCVKG
jgi:hypothetical protein